MSERYTRVFFLPENLYALGSPVVISAGALLKDNQTGKVLAQLKLTNIQYKKIKAVKVKLFPLDTMGQSLGEAIDYQYLDLQLTRDGDFGSKTPIPFPDATARAFEAEVITVAFADNTAWNTDSSPWGPIPGSIPLHRQYDNLVIEQLRLEQSGTCQFVVQEYKDLWVCTCGAVNHDGEARCHDCGKQLSQIHPLDVEGLTERAKQRLAEEARQAAEEKAAREAALAATKKKTAKILKVIIPALCTVIALALLMTKVIIPNSKYNDAVALMDAGQYEEAIAAFEAMDGYKDSAEQITKCEDAIVAAEQARIEAEMAAKFAQAEELLAVGDFDDAIAIFESLADYEGSAEGIAAAEESKMTAAYKAAKALAAEGENAKAAIAFGKLGDYEDSRERSLELWASLPYPYESIGAGRYHTVALLNDGTVKATGHKEYGQCDTESWKDVIAISVGNTHTVGLKPDGTVIGTGSDYKGCLQISDWTDIVFVSAGGGHTVGLNVDGTVVATGTNKNGQCNVSGWKDIIAISSGDSHTVGLKADGTVVAVGWNNSGQCDVSEWTDIIAISAGHSHTVGLKSDGTVVSAGKKIYLNQYTHRNQVATSEWRDIISVYAGWDYTLGLKSDGTAIVSGFASWRWDDGTGWTDIVAISAKENHMVGLKSDGTMIAAGDNNNSECNVSSWKNIKLPN